MKIKNKQLFSMALGLTACVLSQCLWAACSATITITKPDSIYIDHLDGTVSDSETGLMWQKCSLGQTWNAGIDANDGSDDSCDGDAISSSWQVALAKAGENTSYSSSDWRLPNKNELHTLVDKACYIPSINETLFPNPQGNFYWSSTPYAGDVTNAWAVSFFNGWNGRINKNNGNYVRLVRGNS